MFFHRSHIATLKKLDVKNKVVFIYGPRRVGKTTLLKTYLESIEESFLLFNGDDIIVQEQLSIPSIDRLKTIIGNHTLIVIDEAQRIKNIGWTMKLLVDSIAGIRILASGSSTLTLSQETGEPLTGRQYTLKLLPLAQMEICASEDRIRTAGTLEERMIYGSYPETILAESHEQKQRYLKELMNSYLLKDLLELEGIRHADKMYKLLQLLALQISSEVSYNELATQLGMSKNTIERYIDLLEKVFVLIKLRGFSRNPRKELSKSYRIYFWDTGVRNAVIQNYAPLSRRNDAGMLWENYLIAERLKKQEYSAMLTNNYFWRTYSRQEIDFLEEIDGMLHAYELKYSSTKSKTPSAWKDLYPDATYETISRDNYLDFIL